MKKMMICFVVIATGLLPIAEAKTVQTPAKVYKPKCETYARQILDSVMRVKSAGLVDLIESKPLQIYHEPAGSNINAEELSYMSEGLTATFTILVGMYQAGSCDLHSLKIGRE